MDGVGIVFFSGEFIRTFITLIFSNLCKFDEFRLILKEFYHIFQDFRILDLRTTEPFRLDSRTFFSNLRTFGLKNLRTHEPSNLRTFGLMRCNQIVRQLERRTTLLIHVDHVSCTNYFMSTHIRYVSYRYYRIVRISIQLSKIARRDKIIHRKKTHCIVPRCHPKSPLPGYHERRQRLRTL